MRNIFTVGVGIYSHQGFETFNVGQYYELVTAPTGYIRSKTLDIERSDGNKERQNKLKLQLPIIMANGVFDQRLNDHLIEYSHYVMMDLDYNLPLEKDQRDADLERIQRDPYTRLVHLSPRKGIKVLVEHNNTNTAHHGELYDAIAAYYGLTSVDPKCRDISRANFICYDPGAKLNPTSEVFKFTPKCSVTPVPLYSPKRAVKVATTHKLLNRYDIKPLPAPLTTRAEINRAITNVQKFSHVKFPVVRGVRNSNLFIFACALHDRGVGFEDALFYLTAKYVAKDFLGDEIEQIIINAYK